jgi:hypothetical protein
MDGMMAGWRILGVGLVSILATIVLALGTLALIKYVSNRK